MQFFDGQTDSNVAHAIARIEWHFRHNVLCGQCVDDAFFRSNIPGASADEKGVSPENGAFELTSAPLAGGQRSVIKWYSHEGVVNFKLFSVSEPQ